MPPVFQRSAPSGRVSAWATVVGSGEGDVEDRGALLGALGLALGHESLERDAGDLGLDAALSACFGNHQDGVKGGTDTVPSSPTTIRSASWAST